MRSSALTCALGLAGALAASTAGAADFSVGSGSACTHHTIADALQQAAQTPEIDTIRIADDQSYVDLIVDIGTSVKLFGGYAQCTDAEPVSRTKAVASTRPTAATHSSRAIDGRRVCSLF